MPEIKIDETTSVIDNKEKKVSGIAKLGKAIINDDFDKIGEYLVSDILIPSIKQTLNALGKNFLDMLFFGEAKSNYGYGSNASSYHNAYNTYSYNTPKRKTEMREQGDWFLFSSSSINSKGDAEVILAKLDADLRRYGRADVAALYEYANETAPHTYYGYGWYNLNEAKTVFGPDGCYCIKLPRPIPLKH